MIVDAFTLLAGSMNAAGVFTGSTTFAQAAGAQNNASNSLDMGSLARGGNQPRALSGSEHLAIVIGITTAFAGAGNCTFQVVQADDADLTSNVEVMATTATFTTAQLAANTLIPVQIPMPDPRVAKRYFGVRNATSGVVSAGAAYAAIVPDIQQVRTGNMVFGSGYTIA